MTIHSFRRVLKVRRHIHAIPWNPGGRALVLPVPIPLLGFTYFAALEVAFFILSRLPIIGSFSHLPFMLWWVIPFWLTYWLLMGDFDNRPAHLWVRSWIQYRARPKRTRAGVAIADDGTQRGRIRWYADEFSAELHRARITGPASVTFRVPVKFHLAMFSGKFVVCPTKDGKPVTHDVIDRMEIRP